MKYKLNKIRIFTIFTILLLFVNLFITVLIFSDIQIINAPKTEVFVDIVEVNSEEVILNAKLKMTNSNGFDIGIQDFKVISMNYEEQELGRLEISGGNIPSSESRIFTGNINIILKESSNLTILKNKISGKINMNLLGFITKTIPIDLMVITSLEKIFENLEIPDINIEAYLTSLYEKGLNFTAKVSVYNPTKLIYNIDDLLLDFYTDQGINVGNITVNGGIVEPNKKADYYSNGTIFYKSLDAEYITLNLKGIAGAKVGGISKNVTFKTYIKLYIPDLKDFVFGGGEIDFQIPVEFKLTFKGILAKVGFNIYNPSNISLIGDNLNCSIYRKDNGELILLGKKLMNPCEIQSGKRICVEIEITIPYLKYLFSKPFKLLPDWIVLKIEGDFFVAGTRQAFPISLSAFINPHILKN